MLSTYVKAAFLIFSILVTYGGQLRIGRWLEAFQITLIPSFQLKALQCITHNLPLTSVLLHISKTNYMPQKLGNVYEMKFYH